MKETHFRLRQSFLLIAVLAIGLQSCGKNDNPVEPIPHGRGAIVRTSPLGTITATTIQQIIVAGNFQFPFTLSHSVTSVSIEYLTIDGKGNETVASGALFIPQGPNNLTLMSIQHGTQTKNDQVASVSPFNSTEGIVGLVAASMGYMAVVPDYLGFGVSKVMHPYLHAESLTPCVIDLMRAARSFSATSQISLNGQILLTGYSEGGYVTLATQKAIEERHSSEFGLRAVAPMAGPYDLRGTAQTILQSGTYNSTVYLGFLLTAYNEFYRWNRLNDFFKAPYASLMPGLFNGSKTWGEVVSQLPSTFSALMNSTFVSNYLSGNEQIVQTALQENTLLNWRPKTPIHFFHGDADEVVPIQNAHIAVSTFTSNGASNVQLTIIPGGTHETAGPIAIIGAIQWFRSL